MSMGGNHLSTTAVPAGFILATAFYGNGCCFFFAIKFSKKFQVLEPLEAVAEMKDAFTIDIGKHALNGISAERVSNIKVHRCVTI